MDTAILSNFLQLSQPLTVPRQTKDLLEEYKSLAKTQLIAFGEIIGDEEAFGVKFVEKFSTIAPSLVEASQSLFRTHIFSCQLLSALPRPLYYGFISAMFRRTKEMTENLPMNPILVICGDIETNPGPGR